MAGSPICVPAAMSHSRAVLSSLPETSRLPSGEKASDVTLCEWPASVLINEWSAAFHSLIARSWAAVANISRSGENTIARISSVWASRLLTSLPATWSQKRTFSSAPDEASCLPSVENATDSTHCLWPSRRCSCRGTKACPAPSTGNSAIASVTESRNRPIGPWPLRGGFQNDLKGLRFVDLQRLLQLQDQRLIAHHGVCTVDRPDAAAFLDRSQTLWIVSRLYVIGDGHSHGDNPRRQLGDAASLQDLHAGQHKRAVLVPAGAFLRQAVVAEDIQPDSRDFLEFRTRDDVIRLVAGLGPSARKDSSSKRRSVVPSLAVASLAQRRPGGGVNVRMPQFRAKFFFHARRENSILRRGSANLSRSMPDSLACVSRIVNSRSSVKPASFSSPASVIGRVAQPQPSADSPAKCVNPASVTKVPSNPRCSSLCHLAISTRPASVILLRLKSACTRCESALKPPNRHR